jgi:hypothetical protein
VRLTIRLSGCTVKYQLFLTLYQEVRRNYGGWASISGVGLGSRLAVVAGIDAQ